MEIKDEMEYYIAVDRMSALEKIRGNWDAFDEEEFDMLEKACLEYSEINIVDPVCRELGCENYDDMLQIADRMSNESYYD